MCCVSVVEEALERSSSSDACLPSTVGMRHLRDGRKRSHRRQSSLFNPTLVDVCVTEEVETQHCNVAEYPEQHFDTGVDEHLSSVTDINEHDAKTEDITAGGQRLLQTSSFDVSKAAMESEHPDLAATQHSTPEPPQRHVSRQMKRKAAQSGTKAERGRRVERAPLKKPWEVKCREIIFIV